MEELIEDLKLELNITWIDVDTENRLERIIKSGKAYLDEMSGTELDYNTNFIANQLLMDYGRYSYNNSLELFELNFKRQLLSLTIKTGVKKRADTEKNTETNP